MRHTFSIVPAFKLQPDFSSFLKYIDSVLSKKPEKNLWGKKPHPIPKKQPTPKKTPPYTATPSFSGPVKSTSLLRSVTCLSSSWNSTIFLYVSPQLPELILPLVRTTELNTNDSAEQVKLASKFEMLIALYS